VRKALLTVIFLAVFLPLTSSQQPGQSERKAMRNLEGEWVGAFELGEELVYLRVQFKTEAQGIKLRVLSMTPGAPGVSTDVRLESAQVHFELRRGSERLVFEGRLDGDTISGSVRQNENRGTFQFARTVQVNSRVYDEYAGAYELQPNWYVFIRRGDRIRQEPPYSIEESWLYYVEESGERRVLYPSSENNFFSGPTYIIPVPVNVQVTFLRTKTVKLEGLVWRKQDQPERFAARSKLYREEEVRFQHGEITLAGRLLVPTREGRHPAVVLIHGFGAANRNEGYLIVADFFARHGIAALVYDKRGTGASSGDWGEASPRDLADDALAAVQLLRGRKDINPKQVGLWALSAGGPVAALAVARDQDLGFLLLVSAPALTLAERYPMMVDARTRGRGFSEEEVREAVAFAKLESEFGRTGERWEEFQAAIEKARSKRWFSNTWTASFGATSKDHPHWRELRRHAQDDPESAFKRITCPLLAIYGELDWAVLPGPNIARLEKALNEGGNQDYTIKVFPSASHNLWLQKTGGYVPGYFDTMTEWLLKRVDVLGEPSVPRQN